MKQSVICWMGYGILVACVFTEILARLNPHPPVVFLVMVLFTWAFCILFAWQVASKPSERTVGQNLLLVAFAPVVCSFGVFVLVTVTLLGIVIWPYMAMRSLLDDRRFRRNMISQGRFMTAREVHPHLVAGEGTLIAERGAKGTFRIWWTSDDLSALGEPASTREEIETIYSGKEHPFNSRCLSEYLDDHSGKAIMTTISPREHRSGRLARAFPQVRLVSVIRPY